MVKQSSLPSKPCAVIDSMSMTTAYKKKEELNTIYLKDPRLCEETSAGQNVVRMEKSRRADTKS